MNANLRRDEFQSLELETTPPDFTGFRIATTAAAAGGALVQLEGRANGREVTVFPPIDLTAFRTEFEENPNRAFQVFGVPLYPLANRLRDPKTVTGTGRTRLLGIDVEFPHNHRGTLPGAPPHHLHGWLFRRKADAYESMADGNLANSRYSFFPHPDFSWGGETRVEVRHSLIQGRYQFEIAVENRGTTAVPVGFGAHPYFQVPSARAEAVRLYLPSDRVAEIDGFDNVFPTGQWQASSGSRFDFNRPSPLPSGKFDHFFLFGEHEPVIEMRDVDSGLGFRMRGLTDNVIGAQFYYPGSGTVLALELVTHLPDPREAVWGNQPTGLTLLEPGKSARYAFEIELFTF